MKQDFKQIRKTKRLETKKRRESQVCKAYELKFDKSHLSKEKLNYLNRLFLESKWFYNNVVASEDIFKFNDKIKDVVVLNKDREFETREKQIPVKQEAHD